MSVQASVLCRCLRRNGCLYHKTPHSVTLQPRRRDAARRRRAGAARQPSQAPQAAPQARAQPPCRARLATGSHAPPTYRFVALTLRALGPLVALLKVSAGMLVSPQLLRSLCTAGAAISALAKAEPRHNDSRHVFTHSSSALTGWSRFSLWRRAGCLAKQKRFRSDPWARQGQPSAARSRQQRQGAASPSTAAHGQLACTASALTAC